MLLKHDGERSRPQGFHEKVGHFGYVRSHFIDLIHATNMHNERIEVRAVFRFEDVDDSVGVERVGGKAVDRFRGNGYELA